MAVENDSDSKCLTTKRAKGHFLERLVESNGLGPGHLDRNTAGEQV